MGDRSVSYGTNEATVDQIGPAHRRRLRHWRRNRVASARIRT